VEVEGGVEGLADLLGSSVQDAGGVGQLGDEGGVAFGTGLGPNVVEFGLEGRGGVPEVGVVLADALAVFGGGGAGVVAELGELGDQPFGGGLVAGDLPAELGALGVAESDGTASEVTAWAEGRSDGFMRACSSVPAALVRLSLPPAGGTRVRARRDRLAIGGGREGHGPFGIKLGSHRPRPRSRARAAAADRLGFLMASNQIARLAGMCYGRAPDSRLRIRGRADALRTLSTSRSSAGTCVFRLALGAQRFEDDDSAVWLLVLLDGGWRLVARPEA